jgi:hypothetical protein
MLLCLLVHAQEADNLGKAEFQVIPRFDFNPYTSIGSGGDGSSGFSFGSSSIYTLLEGALSDNFSYLVSNHWLSTEPGDLYSSTFMSNTSNWLDYCYVDFTFGNFDLVVGKDAILTGGIEFDEWDVDVDDILASELWYTLPVYQWGAKIGYTTGSGNTSFYLQAATSPYGEYFFKSKLFAYSAQWKGNYGPLSTIWSASALERETGRFDYLFALGQSLELGDWTIEADWYSSVGMGEYLLLGGHTIRLATTWAPSEKFDIGLKGNYYISKSVADTESWFNGGLACHFYPLRNSQAIRLHADVGYDSGMSQMLASVGIKVNLYLFKL